MINTMNVISLFMGNLLLMSSRVPDGWQDFCRRNAPFEAERQAASALSVSRQLALARDVRHVGFEEHRQCRRRTIPDDTESDQPGQRLRTPHQLSE